MRVKNKPLQVGCTRFPIEYSCIIRIICSEPMSSVNPPWADTAPTPRERETLVQPLQFLDAEGSYIPANGDARYAKTVNILSECTDTFPELLILQMCCNAMVSLMILFFDCSIQEGVTERVTGRRLLDGPCGSRLERSSPSRFLVIHLDRTLKPDTQIRDSRDT